jgi:homoserine/homoserine lactone efflux protein
MTMDIWFAFAAIVMVFVLLPNPLARLVASFSRQRGRLSAFVTLPPMVLGLTLALIAAAVPLALVAIYVPAAIDGLSWIGLGYLMLYLLWSLQSPQRRVPVADNDNLPERRYGRIMAHVARQSFTLRHVLVLAALVVQFLDPAMSLSSQLPKMALTFVVCVTIGGLIQALFPRIFLRRRKYVVGVPASNKPGTVFIARRAVTAGFRRIAA